MFKPTKEFAIRKEPFEPVEFVRVEKPFEGESDLPQRFRNKLLITTVHDGEILPEPFWEVLVREWGKDSKKLETFEKYYILERDWGADLVAYALVKELNRLGYRCEGFYRVNVARVLMDFGRFPGITPPEATLIDRYAINYPFSYLLNYELKKHLLESYYDKISELLEPVFLEKTISISIHTYDRYNEAGTERPITSVISRPISYQLHSKMPFEYFDPMYPSILGEYTADRRLVYRLSLMLERSGFSVATNYPYLLPNGSLEVRAQVWFFFQYLRKRFEEAYPESKRDPAFIRVWEMLLDTNLRSANSDRLRSYIHAFRRAPEGKEILFDESRKAYEKINEFLYSDDEKVIQEYRHWSERPSSLGIEVRKDFVWEFPDMECRQPGEPLYENAEKVAKVLAEGLMVYFTEDRSEDPKPVAPWGGRIRPSFRPPPSNIMRGS